MRPLKVSFFFLIGFYVFFAASALEAGDRADLFITQIAIHPLQPNIVYAVSTYSTGVLKSTDGGLHWFLINQGIKSYSLYHFAVDPREINTLYLGAGGGGLYKSVDGGNHWMEMNDGFQDTDIGQMFLYPDDPDRVYVVSATGVYKSPDGGRHWEAWNQGDNFTLSQEFQNLVVIPGKPDRFFLASKQGLYTRSEGDPAWRPASKEMEGRQISALAVDPGKKRLYAAVLREGTTLKGGGLFVSDDYGTHWKIAAPGIEKDWIRVIRFDPSDLKHLYLATSNRGILSGYEGGAQWRESNKGMGPLDIRSLAIDPSNSRILFAGAHGEGIFKSTDGGGTWSHPGEVPFLDSKTIIAQLTTPDPARKRPEIVPPPAFVKCNKCHGWTDPYLNLVHGFWLVPPNRRNWNLTVQRMSKGAGLTAEEEKSVEDFLKAYSEKYGGSP